MKNIGFSTSILFILFASIALSSCKTRESEQRLIVSIAPIKFIVERITCGDFPVEILVEEGSSPETYSPTPSQMAGSEKTPLLFVTGLIDFEVELSRRLRNNGQKNIANLSEGIELIEGTCTHNHEDHSHHHHGVDPHIWTSPEQLKVMANNAFTAIRKVYPDSLKYVSAYENLITELTSLSSEVRAKIDSAGVRYFLIYHPAFTYYARDYGLEQIPIEYEGKEPSAVYMQQLVSLARDNDIQYVFYQREYSPSTVRTMANEINATPMEVNPLAEGIVDEIRRFTNLITNVN